MGKTWIDQFQSTHPVWGATFEWLEDWVKIRISIHAPRMGCDLPGSLRSCGSRHFNPRTPYGVRRRLPLRIVDRCPFQSTHPVWGATRQSTCCLHGADFNPRTPYGVRRVKLHAVHIGKNISIHAPRMGCDIDGTTALASPLHFNPRTPYGVRPLSRVLISATLLISIHAPRMGCDDSSVAVSQAQFKFQSTHPVWGATCPIGTSPIIHMGFQSTHPVWGATP